MKWLKRTKILLEMLVVLCHLLEGQPIREAEMTTLRCKNSVHEQKEVYWANRSVMLLGIYSKTRSMTGRNSLISRWDVKTKCIIDETGFCRRDWGFCWRNISSWWGQWRFISARSSTAKESMISENSYERIIRKNYEIMIFYPIFWRFKWVNMKYIFLNSENINRWLWHSWRSISNTKW